MTVRGIYSLRLLVPLLLHSENLSFPVDELLMDMALIHSTYILNGS